MNRAIRPYTALLFRHPVTGTLFRTRFLREYSQGYSYYEAGKKAGYIYVCAVRVSKRDLPLRPDGPGLVVIE